MFKQTTEELIIRMFFFFSSLKAKSIARIILGLMSVSIELTSNVLFKDRYHMHRFKMKYVKIIILTSLFKRKANPIMAIFT